MFINLNEFLNDPNCLHLVVKIEIQLYTIYKKVAMVAGKKLKN